MTLLFMAFAMALTAAGASAGDVDCKMCHSEKYEGKSVHPALNMGCAACHTGVDATEVPHKMPKAGPAKGLSAERSDLCFGCHDKGKFSGQSAVHPPVMGGMCANCHNPHRSDNDKLLLKPLPDLCHDCHDKTRFNGPTVHAPVGIGLCTSCHASHMSNFRKLLIANIPDTCYTCHDKAEYTKKFGHKPVGDGSCLSCHAAHAGQNASLLLRKGNLLCRTCHQRVEREPHAVAGFKATGHPVRGRTDPIRAGKTFGCLSCHLPHSSEWLSLFRYKSESMFDLCLNCHQM